MSIDVLDLGLVEYARAWQLQQNLSAEIAAGKRGATLLLLEHPHVYTFGRSGRQEHLLVDESVLRERGLQVHWVDRGGDVTYHGPGQLVGYPLIPLGALRRPPGIEPRSAPGPLASVATSGYLRRVDYVGYVRLLERTIIHALAMLGIAAGQRRGYTGVWVQPEVWSRCLRCRPEHRGRPAKIAAIGVKVDVRGISRHGFALNVSPDMSYWDGIVACGLAGEPVACMADLLDPVPSMSDVKAVISRVFREALAVSP